MIDQEVKASVQELSLVDLRALAEEMAVKVVTTSK